MPRAWQAGESHADAQDTKSSAAFGASIAIASSVGTGSANGTMAASSGPADAK
jgi:hypothetical protein